MINLRAGDKAPLLHEPFEGEPDRFQAKVVEVFQAGPGPIRLLPELKLPNGKIHRRRPLLLENEPQWYKDAVIYELHVRSFYDSNNDGIGDFKGLVEKLEFLEGLGVTALWLLPFYPSPLKDDGYDIADYYDINPQYGTLKDFKEFLKKAHEKNIRVITELVINHTSNEHPWFQRARREKPGSPFRDFYVWNNTPEKYRDARIIFKDFESSNWSWDAVAQAYYWHRFYSHQPDLNFENPQVRKPVRRVLDFPSGLLTTVRRRACENDAVLRPSPNLPRSPFALSIPGL